MDAAHYSLHGHRGVTKSASGLTAFQIELAQDFFSLPESRGFLLAGGGALIAQGIVPRPTDDLDFFTARGAGDVASASDALTRACQERGWTVEVIREGPEFRRLEITGTDTVLVDLAIDSPASGTPQVTIAGPTLSTHDLAARKTLALFGRAEPRDFVDVYVLAQQFSKSQLLAAAAEADSGFNLPAFAAMLRSHMRLIDVDFPDVGVPIEAIRDFCDGWADDLQAA